MRPILQALFVFVCAAPAAAQVDVLVLGTKPGPQSNCTLEDVAEKIAANGPFGAVDWLNARQVTPTVAQLLAYDAVLVYTHSNQFDQPILLGDNLADYVDAGGGVVAGMSACGYVPYQLGGRWRLGYEVIPPQFSMLDFGQEGLGTIELPNHPVMNGVNTFEGGTFGLFGSQRPSTNNVLAGSSIIARWTDDMVLVAEGATPRRIDLGFVPPSNDCGSNFWLADTDGGLLMANALRYVAGQLVPIGTTVCTPGVGNSTGQPGVMQLFGSPIAADNDLTLAGFQLPPDEFAYFLASRSFGFVAGPGGSMGNLCTVGQFARFNLQLGQIVNGSFSIDVDLTSVPEPPNGNHTVLAGETWYWQCWYRDVYLGQATSNFTDAVELLFQ